ncbi:SCO family protein [Shewanella seohaensis]|uniref:SCO family protein n=1 Tax=Shewanella seohaensis TaxID=755175 RepID=UPI0035BB1346
MNKPSSFISAVLIVAMTLLILPAIAYLNQAISGSYGIATHQETEIDFTWQDIHGKTHQFSDWSQGPSYLFLGFLSCSQICPIRVHQVHSLMAQLTENERTNIRFLFISIDPQNDLPALRAQLIDSQSAQFYSAELAPEQLETLQRQLAEISSQTSDINLHTGNLYLVSPTGKLKQTYTQQQLITERLRADLTTMMSSN